MAVAGAIVLAVPALATPAHQQHTMSGTGVPDSPDVTESRSSGSATLAITGLLTPASIDFGYLGKNGDSATSSTASALTDETVTVTLDTLTTDGSVAAGSGGARSSPPLR